MFLVESGFAVTRGFAMETSDDPMPGGDMKNTIKGTRTEKNLMAAFAGESQTFNRYSYFAEAARKEGYEQIANIFLDTANNERAHAWAFYQYLEGGGIEITATYPSGPAADTRRNLEAAVAGENAAWTLRYEDFASTAGEENFPEIASTFEHIAVAEKFQEGRFRRLMVNLEKNEVFKKNASVKWHCTNCGYVLEGKEAPRHCPACHSPQAFYEVLAENY
jgi:rubrerythrin